MITTLRVRRFKSISSLDLQCRKVNVLIGAPDTGKTNILEALTLVSRLGASLPLDGSLRLRRELGFDPLFHRQFFDQPFEIEMSFEPSLNARDDSWLSTAKVSGRNLGSGSLNVEGSWGVTQQVGFGGFGEMPVFRWLRAYASALVTRTCTSFSDGTANWPSSLGIAVIRVQ